MDLTACLSVPTARVNGAFDDPFREREGAFWRLSQPSNESGPPEGGPLERQETGADQAAVVVLFLLVVAARAWAAAWAVALLAALAAAWKLLSASSTACLVAFCTES